jgi:uroporphyrinogen III methyltransferase/synthase
MQGAVPVSAADSPLGGLTVLLTRDPDRASTAVSRLRSLGAEVDARAVIAFEPPLDPAPADAAVARLADYHWLVFTSPNGVARFAERARARGIEIPAGRRGVAAIGGGTARALEAIDLPPEVVATEADSAGLARALLARVRESHRVLIVRPEVAGDRVPNALRDAGARVDEVAFYRTVASPGAEELAVRVAEGAYDAIIFTSPSNLNYLLKAGGARGVPVERGIASARRIAIGKITAAALGKEGFAAHAVARTPDDQGIINALLGAVS